MKKSKANYRNYDLDLHSRVDDCTATPPEWR